MSDPRLPEFRAAPGETVLWTGHPDPAVTFARNDMLLIPFSLVWAGFAVFWEFSVLTSTVQTAPARLDVFAIVGAVFVAVGLYIVLGRFFVKAWRKRRTTYAITTTRVVSVVGGRSREVRLPASGITETRSANRAHLSVVFDGPPATARFGQAAVNGIYRNSGLDLWTNDTAVGLYDVSDVDGLDAALTRLRTPR